VSESVDREVLAYLVGVIAWELDAQAGVHRPIERMAPLVADAIVDYFDVRLKPGVTPPSI